jgi:nucleoid DNA-binding protein
VLTKHQIAAEVVEILEEDADFGLSKRAVAEILDALAILGLDELAEGEDFQIPGLVKISWAYTKPQKKGERYKKGDTYTGFGGIENVAEEDSKERKAAVRLVAKPIRDAKALAPSTRDRAAQRKFLSTKAGKAIAARKG